MSQDNALQMDLSFLRIIAANVFFFLIEKQIRHFKSLTYYCIDFHEHQFALAFG